MDRPKRNAVGGVTLEQIEAALRSIKRTGDRPAGVFTTNEYAAAVGLTTVTAGRKIFDATRAGVLEYAGKIPITDRTGRLYPTHAYRLKASAR